MDHYEQEIGEIENKRRVVRRGKKNGGNWKNKYCILR